MGSTEVRAVPGMLHHVEIYCVDLGRTREFWGWFLGRLGYDLYQEWPNGCSFRLGQTYLVFVRVEPRFAGTLYHRCGPGLNHLAFRAASRSQVDEMTDLLRKRGMRILYEDRHPHAGGLGTYAVYFEDPDRMKVELTAPDVCTLEGAGAGEYTAAKDTRLAFVQRAVERELACSAHNLAHVRRVVALCRQLAQNVPDVDLEILELASLLHDVARIREDLDDTGATDHAKVGAEMAAGILRSAGYPDQTLRHVCACIATHRFRGSASPESVEARLLFDADKLDSLGAVGIARAYMLAATYGEDLYSDEDPEVYVARNHVGGLPTGRIRTLSAHTPNLEFEIAFKRIPERLFTERARALAAGRLAVMQSFFDQLKQELGGVS